MSERLRVGPYEALFELAAGGMGTVYVARKFGPGGFERLTVLKRVHSHLLKDKDFLDMVRDEAKIASLISHPNVVGVEDVVDSGGELILAQPYIESVSFASLLGAANQAGERLPPNAVVRIVTDVLAGLHAAHEAKDLRGEPLHVVHRDVSPHNVLVGTDGLSRLIDFGIAKAERRITHTKSGVMKGKLAYMAPEALRATALDRRADVFSTGVMLHEALTGKKVFRAVDEGDLLLAIMLQEIDAPSAVLPSLSATLDAPILKALERRKDDRFATASELREALEQAFQPASPRDIQELVERLCRDRLKELRDNVRKGLDAAANAATIVDRTLPSPFAGQTDTSEAEATQKAPRTELREHTVQGADPTMADRKPPALEFSTKEDLATPSSVTAGVATPHRPRKWWGAALLVTVLVCGVLALAWGQGGGDRNPKVDLLSTPIPSAATVSLSQTISVSAEAEAEPTPPLSASRSPPSPVPRKPTAPAKTAELHKNPYQ